MKKQTRLRMSTDEEFYWMRVENKICFTVRLFQKKKKQQAFFLLIEAEVAEIKMTTKTEADAFKQSNHVSLESF